MSAEVKSSSLSDNKYGVYTTHKGTGSQNFVVSQSLNLWTTALVCKYGNHAVYEHFKKQSPRLTFL